MKAIIISVLLFCSIVAAPSGLQTSAVNAKPDLKQVFEQYTGVQLVFNRANLPEGRYYEILPPLSEGEQIRAAQIALREAKKYPAGYPKGIGLKCIGIFRSCA